MAFSTLRLSISSARRMTRYDSTLDHVMRLPSQRTWYRYSSQKDLESRRSGRSPRKVRCSDHGICETDLAQGYELASSKRNALNNFLERSMDAIQSDHAPHSSTTL